MEPKKEAVSRNRLKNENDQKQTYQGHAFPNSKIQTSYVHHPPLALTSRKRHALLNLLNRLPRVQSFGTCPATIHNRMASVQRHAVIQHTLPLLLMLVPGIRQPAVGLEQHGGTKVFLAVPPVRGAGG